MSLVVSEMDAGSWDDVRSVYEEGIATGHATFEERAPSWEAWDRNHLSSCRLVASEDGTLLGWAALAGVCTGAWLRQAFTSALAHGDAAWARRCLRRSLRRPRPPLSGHYRRVSFQRTPRASPCIVRAGFEKSDDANESA